MHDTVKTHRRCPFVILLFLDILITAFVVFTVYYAVYELPAVYPRGAVVKSARSNSQTSSRKTPILSAPKKSANTTAKTSINQIASVPVVDKASGSADWKTKFANHFTQDIVSTDTSYSSPDLSVDITKHTIGSGDNTVIYYIADIYMADISSFQTHFANGTYGNNKQALSEMSKEIGSILAMNGDSYCFNLKHLNGLLVRNGTVYRSNPTTADICLLYSDGTMVTSSPNDFDEQQALDGGALQTWVFGPKLLDDNGKAQAQFNTWDYIRKRHPRSAIGYFEPGHYCFGPIWFCLCCRERSASHSENSKRLFLPPIRRIPYI